MFWRAFGLALLSMVALAGLAGTATFAALWATKDSGPSQAEVEATATAMANEAQATTTVAFAQGRQAAKDELERCDTIVGGNAKGPFTTAGQAVPMNLTIRSNKTGNQYEVVTHQVCTVNDALTACQSPPEYQIGQPWPPACQ
jgi:hypothetical protein